MNRRSRGISMAEVMVASFAFMIVMMIGAGALQVVKRASQHLEGRSLPRQQLRALLGHLQRDVRAATFLFDPHLGVRFGTAFSHQYEGAPTAVEVKDEILFALAESPDNAPTYTVMGLFLQPDPSPTAGFREAHRMVLASVSGMSGATPGSPADIPLGSLPAARAEVRTFATASPEGGLKIRRSASGDGLSFEFVIGHRNEGEKVTLETYQSQLTMRNNR